MKKICLTLVGIYMMMLHAFAQKYQDTRILLYIPKPLKFEEANLVSSYYTQDGNHSPITGGIGTEKVMDLSKF